MYVQYFSPQYVVSIEERGLEKKGKEREKDNRANYKQIIKGEAIKDVGRFMDRPLGQGGSLDSRGC